MAQIVLLKIDEACTTVLPKYSDLTDVFLPELVAELLKYAKINNYAIDLVNDKQSFYKPIYSLELRELENLKQYIKINLVNGFLISFQSLVNTSILFV